MRLFTFFGQCWLAALFVLGGFFSHAQGGLFIAKNAHMAMGIYTPEVRMADYAYGFSPRFSAGVGTMYLRSDDRVDVSRVREAAYFQANYLLHRLYQPEGVGNLYVFGGFGSARATPDATVRQPFGDSKTLSHWGIQGDYETRLLYFNANIHWYRTSEFVHRLETYQVGITPFKADYEDWSPWLVLRAERRSDLTTGTEVFPVIRVFRKAWWIEAGRSTRGANYFNIMHTF
jgi:hypothetical protein